MHAFREFPISHSVWGRLVAANRLAVQSGWGEPGVFPTAIGPAFQPGGPRSILYVGKSPGPLGEKVGVTYDQKISTEACTRWMLERCNRSAFWQLIELIDPTRRSIAWTNVCKMDQRRGAAAPAGSKWEAVREPCMVALAEEIEHLRPMTVLFVTSRAYRRELDDLLGHLGYRQASSDGVTDVLSRDSGRRAIVTRHPQGWPNAERSKLLSLINGT